MDFRILIQIVLIEISLRESFVFCFYEASDSKVPEDSSLHNIEDAVDAGLDTIIEILEQDPPTSTRPRDAYEIWQRWGEISETVMSRIIRKLMPYMLELGTELDITSECSRALYLFLFALKERKTWAIKFLDASGKMPSGIFEGATGALGNFDQCLSIRVNQDNAANQNSNELFRGRYCMTKWEVVLPPRPKELYFTSRVFNFTGTGLENTFLEDMGNFVHVLYGRYIHLGVCIPSSCTKEDLQQLIIPISSKIETNATVSSCYVEGESINLSTGQIAVLSYFAFLIALILLGTVVDVGMRLLRFNHPKPRFVESLLCFSAYTNFLKLMNPLDNDSNTCLRCLHGIKVLTMAWIILDHCYLLYPKEIFSNPKMLMHIVKSTSFQAVYNGFLGVDTFFFVGALISSYGQFKVLKAQDGRMNLLMPILHRILRFTPTLSVIVSLIIVWHLITKAPMWDIFLHAKKACDKNWWATLVYINNWQTWDDMCYQPTWYTSCDVQLCVIYFAVPYIIFKSPKLGIFITVFIALLGIVAMQTTALANGITGISSYHTPDSSEIHRVMQLTHFKTYSHFTSYSMGVIVAYLLTLEKKLEIPLIIQAIFWLLSPVLLLTALLGTKPWNSGESMGNLISYAYALSVRTAWILPQAWIIYACGTGRAGVVNRFLSWNGFIPLSRLSLCVFLINVIIIVTRSSAFRERIPSDFYTMFSESMVNTGYSLGAALILSLVVETPFNRLFKLWLATSKETRNAKSIARVQQTGETITRL